MRVFDSEEAANAAKEMMQPPPDGSATLERVHVAEVVASA
jgi:hypothetical protein